MSCMPVHLHGDVVKALSRRARVQRTAQGITDLLRFLRISSSDGPHQQWPEVESQEKPYTVSGGKSVRRGGVTAGRHTSRDGGGRIELPNLHPPPQAAGLLLNSTWQLLWHCRVCRVTSAGATPRGPSLLALRTRHLMPVCLWWRLLLHGRNCRPYHPPNQGACLLQPCRLMVSDRLTEYSFGTRAC